MTAPNPTQPQTPSRHSRSEYPTRSWWHPRPGRPCRSTQPRWYPHHSPTTTGTWLRRGTLKIEQHLRERETAPITADRVRHCDLERAGLGADRDRRRAVARRAPRVTTDRRQSALDHRADTARRDPADRLRRTVGH